MYSRRVPACILTGGCDHGMLWGIGVCVWGDRCMCVGGGGGGGGCMST